MMEKMCLSGAGKGVEGGPSLSTNILLEDCGNRRNERDRFDASSLLRLSYSQPKGTAQKETDPKVILVLNLLRNHVFVFVGVY